MKQSDTLSRMPSRRPAPRGYKRAFFGVFLTFSLIFLGATGYFIVADATATTAIATVTGESPRHREGLGWTVEFVTADGTVCSAYMDSREFPGDTRVGSRFELRYSTIGNPCTSPSLPGSNRLGTMFCFSVMFTVIGGVGSWIAWRHTKPNGTIAF